MQASLEPVRPGDLPLLLRFVEAYYRFEGIAFRSAAIAQALRPLVDSDRYGRIWMVAADARPAGYLALCFSYSIESLGRDALIDEFFIAPAYRGRGLGRRALELLIAEARALGVKSLYLEVGRDNRAARRLYQSLGFSAREKFFLMDRRLDA